jgi:hypothetical protein
VIALPASIVSRRHPFAGREGCAVAQTFPLGSPATHRSVLLLLLVGVVVVPVVVVPVEVAPAGAQATDNSAPPLFGFSSRADLLHFIE